MAFYRFGSEWRIEARVDEVYEALLDWKGLSAWWPSIRDVRLVEEGQATGIGTRVAYSIKSPLPYSLDFNVRVVELDRPTRIHLTATGDLEGTGTWQLGGNGRLTVARYAWNVRTTKRWMNAVAPVARPAFAWAHNRVMAEGARGLASRLGGTLVSASSALGR